MGTTFYNNCIYFYGGLSSNKLFKYDITTNTITLINETGKNKRSGSIIIVNDKLYSVGGTNLTDEDYHNTLDVYDLLTNTWSELTIPSNNIVNRTYPKLFNKDNLILITGGSSFSVSDEELHKIWVLDITTNTIEEKGTTGTTQVGNFFM